MFEKDETPRPDTTLEKLAKLRPPYPDGICTAGNSSSDNDGAAALDLMSETNAKEPGVSPMAYFRSCAVAGTDPTLTYSAVPASSQKALQKPLLQFGTCQDLSAVLLAGLALIECRFDFEKWQK
jgi:acetyl-CoA C-acetyltransferase